MSHRRLAAGALGALVLLVAACQETGAPASPQAAAKAPVAPAADVTKDEAIDAQAVAEAKAYVYDPVGKRDPFRSFVLDKIKDRDDSAKGPLEQFDLSQLSVTGVVWKGSNRRALVIDPSGQAYIVAEGDRIGKNEGHIITISDSRMTVKESYVDFHGDRTTKEIDMRIRQSQGG